MRLKGGKDGFQVPKRDRRMSFPRNPTSDPVKPVDYDDVSMEKDSLIRPETQNCGRVCDMIVLKDLGDRISPFFNDRYPSKRMYVERA